MRRRWGSRSGASRRRTCHRCEDPWSILSPAFSSQVLRGMWLGRVTMTSRKGRASSSSSRRPSISLPQSYSRWCQLTRKMHDRCWVCAKFSLSTLAEVRWPRKTGLTPRPSCQRNSTVRSAHRRNRLNLVRSKSRKHLSERKTNSRWYRRSSTQTWCICKSRGIFISWEAFQRRSWWKVAESTPTEWKNYERSCGRASIKTSPKRTWINWDRISFRKRPRRRARFSLSFSHWKTTRYTIRVALWMTWGRRGLAACCSPSCWRSPIWLRQGQRWNRRQRVVSSWSKFKIRIRKNHKCRQSVVKKCRLCSQSSLTSI